MNNHPRIPAPRNILAGTIAALFVAHTAPAADVTWDITPGTVGAGDSAITGGTGAWDTTTGNWTTDAGVNNIAWVNANNDTAIFGGTAGTVTLGAPITAGGLTFNTTGYIVAGNTLTLTAPKTISVTNAGDTATIGSILAGTVGLTKSGLGDLVLSNNSNSLTGGVTVSAGKLVVGTGAVSTGTIGSNAVSITTGATLEFNNSGSTSVTLANVFSGAGTAVFTGANTGAVGSLAGQYGLSGNSNGLTSTFTITANSARLSVGATTQVGGATLANTGNGQIYFTVAGPFANPITIQGLGWGKTAAASAPSA